MEVHEYWHNYYIKNREKRIVAVKNSQTKCRMKVLEKYSNGMMNCALCGETDLIVLTIDHIDGKGNKHRREIGNGKNSMTGSKFYLWLIKNNYPTGFRVLCHNCNFRERMRLRDNI